MSTEHEVLASFFVASGSKHSHVSEMKSERTLITSSAEAKNLKGQNKTRHIHLQRKQRQIEFLQILRGK